MPDAIFTHPRLARVYDPLDPDRSDLDVYAAMVREFNARRVLDIGCGTGALACLLAARGVCVTGVDPAAASLDVARAQPHARGVTWIHGVATDALPLHVDLVFMTANVAQVFLEDADWDVTLQAARKALVPGGRLVFETRVPERQAWKNWTREKTRRVVDIPEEGPVEQWKQVIHHNGDRVTFATSTVFHRDEVCLNSTSTLRFRTQAELDASLRRAGLAVDEVRDAPDRPGLEWVYIARRR